MESHLSTEVMCGAILVTHFRLGKPILGEEPGTAIKAERAVWDSMAANAQIDKRWTPLAALITFAAAMVSVFVTYCLADRGHGVVYLWPLTAVELGFLIPLWHQSKVRILAQGTGAVGALCGALLAGRPMWFACSVAAISLLDVWIAGTILSRGVRGFDDLKKRGNLLLLALAAIAAPIIGGTVKAYPLSRLLHMRPLDAGILSTICESLGMVIVLPALLFLLTGRNRDPRKLRPVLRHGVPAAALFTAVAWGIFAQTTSPFLFMVFPAMLVILFVLGLEGAVYVSITLSAIAIVYTSHGHGPFWIVRLYTPHYRVLLLQSYIWMSVATALPIGALLDERREAEREAADARLLTQTILKYADVMIILSSIDGSRRYVSAASERFTGWTPGEWTSLKRAETMHPEDRLAFDRVVEDMVMGKRDQSFRYRLAQKRGGWRWIEAAFRTYIDDETGVVRGYVGTLRDMPEQDEDLSISQNGSFTSGLQRSARLVRRDMLTGLPDRRAFQKSVRDQADAARLTDGVFAILFIQINHFKDFYEKHGSAHGDSCLRTIVTALRSSIGQTNDLLARWGEDQFIALLTGPDIRNEVHQRKDAAMQAVRALAIEHKATWEGFVTLNVGTAVSTPELLGDVAAMIHLAEAGLTAQQSIDMGRGSPQPLLQRSDVVAAL